MNRWTRAAEKRRAEIDAQSEMAADLKRLLEALPRGQRMQLMKDETCAEILRKYGMTE